MSTNVYSGKDVNKNIPFVSLATADSTSNLGVFDEERTQVLVNFSELLNNESFYTDQLNGIQAILNPKEFEDGFVSGNPCQFRYQKNLEGEAFFELKFPMADFDLSIYGTVSSKESMLDAYLYSSVIEKILNEHTEVTGDSAQTVHTLIDVGSGRVSPVSVQWKKDIHGILKNAF